MTSGPITSWQIGEKNLETVADFIFLGSKITAGSDCNQKIKRHLFLGEKLWQTILLFSCLVGSTLYDFMDCSMSGFPVFHYLRVCSDSSPQSPWCHPNNLSSVVPFSSCLKSFPTSGCSPVSHLFTSGGQCIGASASASVLSRILWVISSWLTDVISLLTLKSLLQHHSMKSSCLWCSAFFMASLIGTWLLEKTALTICTLQTFVDKTMLMFRFVIALLPRTSIFKVHGCSHCPQWFWSPGK